MRPCLAIDSDYLNIGIKLGMKKVPSHEILFIPTFAPSIKFIHTHFLSMGIMKDSTNKIFLRTYVRASPPPMPQF